MADIEIEIDGKICQASPNEMVIQVADKAGIYIPRFCYHKHLSIAANCRMCLVEVEKAPKPLPACATPVMAGMKVFTKSAKALAAQKAVMEFLLINHPLDCPICDQGGECELQDLSMGYGADKSSFKEGKRAVENEDLGALISTEMTRCIHCTRCVRFGDEIAGMRELGVTYRGGHSEIGTYIQHTMQSEVSGNVIDLCPVGALTSKPFRFTARAWELQQYPSIAAHDCMGTHVNVHTRQGTVMRVVPRENTAVNQTWMSDRDRFSYQGLNHPDRLQKPMIRVQGKWQETDWETAFDVAVGLLQKTLSAHSVEKLGALASPNSTLEEFYLLQKLMRSLGSDHLDHRLRQVDFRDQDSMGLFPGLNEPIDELENADAMLFVGSHVQKEQPIALVRLRRAIQNHASVSVVNMIDYRFSFPVLHKEIVSPIEFPLALARIAKAVGCELPGLDDVVVTKTAKAIAVTLKGKKQARVFLGTAAYNHPHASVIRVLAQAIADKIHGKVCYLTEGANTAGAWLAGCLPHRGPMSVKRDKPGLNAQSMLCDTLKAYLLLNVEPDLDCANPVIFSHALHHAECVIALTSFKNPILEQFAHVMLPISPFTETSGTFVNAAGTWQTFAGSATPLGETRPAWKVLRVLGNWLQLPGFEYESSNEIRQDVKQLLSMVTLSEPTPVFIDLAPALINDISIEEDTLIRIGEVPMYSVDGIVRRATALQETQSLLEGELAAIRIHPKTAERFGLVLGQDVVVQQRDIRVHLPVVLDERIPLHSAFIASGLPATSGLSELFGPVQLLKV